jgi:hypothetical protein
LNNVSTHDVKSGSRVGSSGIKARGSLRANVPIVRLASFKVVGGGTSWATRLLCMREDWDGNCRFNVTITIVKILDTERVCGFFSLLLANCLS